MSIDTGLPGSAAGAGEDPQAPVAIAGYENLTVAQVLPRLQGLSVCHLHQVADYERRHAHRHAVLQAIERLLA